MRFLNAHSQRAQRRAEEEDAGLHVMPQGAQGRSQHSHLYNGLVAAESLVESLRLGKSSKQRGGGNQAPGHQGVAEGCVMSLGGCCMGNAWGQRGNAWLQQGKGEQNPPSNSACCQDSPEHSKCLESSPKQSLSPAQDVPRKARAQPQEKDMPELWRGLPPAELQHPVQARGSITSASSSSGLCCCSL